MNVTDFFDPVMLTRFPCKNEWMDIFSIHADPAAKGLSASVEYKLNLNQQQLFLEKVRMHTE